MKLISACLLGINCKYNGGNNRNGKAVELSKEEILIPICPEQLGGLPTPRERAEQKGKKVFSESGKNIAAEFARGAKEVLKIAELYGVKVAILKQRSPSCGSGSLKLMSGEIIKGDGVTTALLKQNGIKVISEEDL